MDKTVWQKAAESQGSTDSERALARLARKAFLSMWSFPNVYSDEGRSSGKGDGKELVDLLVVFGNDVLLFSDKHCAFQSDVNIRIAWPRWYKRAIEKSAKQLSGAESFMRRFPHRLFIDKSCQSALPLALPDASASRYFLIAVTRGAHEATANHFGCGSSGSLMLNSFIKGEEHYLNPFQVGFPLASRRFIHVLDEMTLDVLLEELDTVPDFVQYLASKERFFGDPNAFIHVAGEEELLAQYMCRFESGRHALPKVPAGANTITLMEGDWRFYRSSPQRAAKREADNGSYMWDALIEHQASFVRAGTAISLPVLEMPPETINHERILRALAAESRLSRRELASHFRLALSKSVPGNKFVRTTLSGDNMSRAYVFLTIPPEPSVSYEAYREMRSAALLAYCHGIKTRFPNATEVIGIASEPFTEKAKSQEFIYLDLTAQLIPEESAFWTGVMKELDVFQAPLSDVQYFQTRESEFPLPFDFDTQRSQYIEPSVQMNRAERRRRVSEVRKAAKEAKKPQS